MGSLWSLAVSALHSRPPNPLKDVLRLAADTFAPRGASARLPVDTTALVAALERLEASDVGIPLPADDLGSPSSPEAVRAADNAAIRYLSLDSRRAYSMGVFFLPRNSRIPLHDHLGMHVVSKLLYGTLHVSSYHIHSDPVAAQRSGSRAEHVLTEVRTGGRDVHVLQPSFANLHEILACTDCAMLDVIGPPYREPERGCQYYALRGSDTVVPIETPADFCCLSASMPDVSQRVAGLLAEIDAERGGRGLRTA
ncbi:hypothetical protein KFE25_006047 [Diacronema lutheri]|nr:hypothetical protein KFE25_006047 [Diacronema lutheri]